MEWRAEGRLDAAGRRRDKAAVDRARCNNKWSVEERRKGECEVRQDVAALGVPFIGLESGGGSRSEELHGGLGVRFEVGRFKDERDTVRRRFIGQKEGGRAALRFGSPRTEEGTASGGAWCGNADRAGGGGSGEGKR
jgi:hypothetical protein